ncbi:MAG: hypothetical protein EPN30_06745 [Actinomycetota bacterium]|nr:MAG: hypothetical protein EPN30_06745 [Actinomycetota bacterium]
MIGLVASLGTVVGSQVVAAAPASAATLTVCTSGCQYTTIAGALAAASNGDTISIGAGIYAGDLTIEKSVRLVGAGTSLTTITGGGIGVINENATLTVEDSTISDNGCCSSNPYGPLYGVGGGIYNTAGGAVTLTHSPVEANKPDNCAVADSVLAGQLQALPICSGGCFCSE